MRIGKRCFVGNLAWKTSWQDLKDIFRECGTVVYTNVMRDENERSKGWGIVEFETPEEAVKAVNELNGMEVAGRKILVREDREDRDVKQYNKDNGIAPPARPPRRERAPPGPRRDAPPMHADIPEVSSGLQVVVQGLPWRFTDDDLTPMFESYGQIEHSQIVYGRDGRSRGYGTIKFTTIEAAQAAIDAYNGQELEGRRLTVKYDRFAA